MFDMDDFIALAFVVFVVLFLILFGIFVTWAGREMLGNFSLF